VGLSRLARGLIMERELMVIAVFMAGLNGKDWLG
jgi:hypothetical protein